VYWPWIQILRELARDQPGADLLAAVGRDAAAVAHLVPELGAPREEAAAEPDPAQARFRLFDAVTSLLKGASRARPLYLVLDDLHVSDPSSLALLHFVARNLRGMRALIVGTYRPEEAQLSAEVGRVLGDVAREGTYLPLVPLEPGQIGEMVARFSGRAAEPALVDAIARTTEGNPLFVDELLRLLLARGDFGAGGGVGCAAGGRARDDDAGVRRCRRAARGDARRAGGHRSPRCAPELRAAPPGWSGVHAGGAGRARAGAVRRGGDRGARAGGRRAARARRARLRRRADAGAER
jgi:hypothetical protein